MSTKILPVQISFLFLIFLIPIPIFSFLFTLILTPFMFPLLVFTLLMFALSVHPHHVYSFSCLAHFFQKKKTTYLYFFFSRSLCFYLVVFFFHFFHLSVNPFSFSSPFGFVFFSFGRFQSYPFENISFLQTKYPLLISPKLFFFLNFLLVFEKMFKHCSFIIFSFSFFDFMNVCEEVLFNFVCHKKKNIFFF